MAPVRPLLAKLFVALCIVLAATADLATAQRVDREPSVTIRSAIDTTVGPCTDFEQYVNGGWRARQTQHGIDMFSEVRVRIDPRLVELLETLRMQRTTARDPIHRMLGQLYESCLASADAVTGGTMPGGGMAKTPQERCLAVVDGLVGPALGHAYLTAIMTPDMTAVVRRWMDSIRDAVQTQITQLPTISDTVRAALQLVVDSMVVRISEPESVPNYDTVVLSETDYRSNRRILSRVHEYWVRDRVTRQTAEYGPPLTFRQVRPYRLSAFAVPGNHALFITTAFLQWPFFDLNAESSANYAALGVIIGHELWHLLTPGADWSSTEQGRANVKNLVLQYHDLGDDGTSTLGENISDLGGVNAAYRAWVNNGRTSADSLIEGFTPDQRFFLYYARLWRSTPGVQRDRAHASPRSRVNGVVARMREFSQAFGCRTGDAMMLPPDRQGSLLY